MKRIPVLLASLLVGLAVQPAAATSPAQTCAESYCYEPDAVLEATVVRGQDLDTVNGRVTLQIHEVHGDAAEVTPGTEIELSARQNAIQGYDYDQRRMLYATRQSDGTLAVDTQYDLAAQYVSHCFGEAPTSAEVAAIVLAPTCADELDYYVHPDFAVDQHEPGHEHGAGCASTTPSGSAGVLVGLGLLGLVARRRRRPRHGI